VRGVKWKGLNEAQAGPLAVILRSDSTKIRNKRRAIRHVGELEVPNTLFEVGGDGDDT